MLQLRRRRWHPQRQAYLPRLWPLLVATLAVTQAINAILWWGVGMRSYSGVVAGVAGLVIMLVASDVRWRLWKRKHPLNVQSWIDAQRRAAPWN